MPVIYHSCVSVTCDRCETPVELDDGEPHFASLADAAAYLSDEGWIVLGDRLLCAQCAARADCELTGHQWETDHDDSTPADDTPHSGATRGWYCRHCPAIDGRGRA